MRAYFMRLFLTDGNRHIDSVVRVLDFIVSAEMNNNLMRHFTKEKILYVMKQMHSFKASGPDGTTPIFFQKFWSLIQNDVLNSALGIFNCGNDPTPLNHTHIVLIPKIKNLETPSDFRPISLCNVIFRIIPKTIANRFKSLLSSVISEFQSAFILCRAIMDNAMIAFEVFLSMKNKKSGKKGFMALKLDMSKSL